MPINFRTSIKHPFLTESITYQHSLMMLGSCFTNSIGTLFNKFQFQTAINPFGITYNPISIAQSLEKIIEKNLVSASDLFFHNEQYGSFLHHGDFNHSDKVTCLDNINETLVKANSTIKNIDYLFLTFGTNTYFKLVSNDSIVNNCHKFPAANFIRQSATAEEISNTLSAVLSKLLLVNPTCKFIFSISPIRYLQDGMYENSLNKANLFLAVKELLHMFPSSYYFPAYEIVLDDLRDYRFYKEDMLHPNDIAIKYIWEQVKLLLIDTTSQELMKHIEKIQLMKSHRPTNSNSDAHKLFLTSIEKEITQLKLKHPKINFTF